MRQSNHYIGNWIVRWHFIPRKAPAASPVAAQSFHRFFVHRHNQLSNTQFSCHLPFILIKYSTIHVIYHNNANLMGLIAATGLVILFKLDSNQRFSARVSLK